MKKNDDNTKITITVSRRDLKRIDARAAQVNRTRAGYCRDLIYKAMQDK